MSEISISVPKELNHTFFFPNGKVSWEVKDETIFNGEEILIYEAAYFAGMESFMPWENDNGESIPLLLKAWEKNNSQLEVLFRTRNQKAALNVMRKGIGQFLQLLHWANGQPVRLSPQIPFESLKLKPVNIGERLEFILSRPNFYPSYKQLIELMKEMEKIYMKAQAVKGLK